MRFKDIEDRGFDILTNDPLNGPGATKVNYQAAAAKPISTWTKTMQNVNRGKNTIIFKYLFVQIL